MKLAHFDFESVFLIKPGLVNILVIEREEDFYRYCNELMSQIDGQNGGFCLSEGADIVGFSKNSVLISDYFSLQVNDKKVLQKLYQSLQTIANDKFYLELENLRRQFSLFFEHLNSESDFPINYDVEDAFSGILKAFDVKIEDEHTFLSKLISYVRIMSEFAKIKCFFFINLKTFLDEKQISEFYHEMQLNEISIFLLENTVKPKLPSEYITVIDRDLCEIIV